MKMGPDESSRPPLQIGIAVCGRFHYHKWVKFLSATQIDPIVYYSHRLSQRPFGNFVARNKAAKEYLMQLHGRVLGDYLLPMATPLYHRIWERAVLRDWVRVPLAHVMLHGNTLDIQRHCRSEGTFVLGEAVNAHVNVSTPILSEEFDRLGLKYPQMQATWARAVEEYAQCDRILVASNWVARSFVAQGFPSSRVLRVPYPGMQVGNPLPRQAPRSTEKTKRILCVAGIQVRKGQHYLLEALRSLNKTSEHFVLTLVGRNTDRSYERALRSMRVPFEHILHIPNDQMIDFMGRYDVFVLPSVEDGFSVVVTEALQAGLPVVTTFNNGAADIIRDGENGYVVPARDAAALAEGIDRASELGRIGHHQDGKSDGWGDYAAQMTRLYEAFGRGTSLA
jgi:glycosyltransferase involved in cell wall biosynthesis